MILDWEIKLFLNLNCARDLELLMEETEELAVFPIQILVFNNNAKIIFQILIILERKQDMKDQEELVEILQRKLVD